MMTPDEIKRARHDALTLKFIVAEIDALRERHPEYLTLQMFDATPLRIVAYNLEDDADQETAAADDAA